MATVQIQSETVYILNSTDTIGEGVNPIILPPAVGMATGQREGKLWILICWTPLKIGLVSHPACSEVCVCVYIYEGNSKMINIEALFSKTG